MSNNAHQLYLAGYLADSYKGTDLATMQAVEAQRADALRDSSFALAYALGILDRLAAAQAKDKTALTAALGALYTGAVDPLNIYYDAYARAFALAVMASQQTPVQIVAPSAPGISNALPTPSADAFRIAVGLGQVDAGKRVARSRTTIVDEIKRLTA